MEGPVGTSASRGVAAPDEGVNVTVLAGELVGDVTHREIAGVACSVFDLRGEVAGSRWRVGVQVERRDFDRLVRSLRREVRAGDRLVVVGSTRRRFFSIGGRTTHRTDVVAVDVLPLTRRVAVAATVDRLTGEVQRSLSANRRSP
jgi:hypothetical protein